MNTLEMQVITENNLFHFFNFIAPSRVLRKVILLTLLAKRLMPGLAGDGSIPSPEGVNCCGVRDRSGQDVLYLLIVFLLVDQAPLKFLLFLSLLFFTQLLLVQHLSQQISLIFLTGPPETVEQWNIYTYI